MNLPQRKSIRLREYDYTQEGCYFVTICIKDRSALFGEIIDGKMILNEYGKFAKDEISNTPSIRHNIRIDHYVVMPNHIHLIIQIVGAYCIRPKATVTPEDAGVCNTPLQSPAQTIGAVVRGIKSATTRKMGFSPWQRGYHEHIIRNEQSYQKINDYITNNGVKWSEDKYYKA